ncbi:MAG: hypothetical protein QW649_05140 [Thermoplasmata archaeon]
MFIENARNSFANWYSSLSERDRKIIVIFVSILLPALGIWVYFKEVNAKNAIENKLTSLPSITQIKSQIFSLEKQRVYYKQNIQKLKTYLLNPEINYANNTAPNQIPIILNSQISEIGGYILSMEEGLPVESEVNQEGLATITNATKKVNMKNKPINQKMFRVELIPINLSVAVSQNNVNTFLANINKPNNAYPFLFINHISLGKGNCNSNILETNNYYIVDAYNNTINTTSPIGICLSGYVISKIEGVRSIHHVNKK